MNPNENQTYVVGMINLTYGNIQTVSRQYYTQDEANKKAKQLNETHSLEAKRLGFDKFIAYNMQAKFPENYIWNNYLG